MLYIDKFLLPIEDEESIISARMGENGGAFGYIDNIYPCGIFNQKAFKQVDFKPLTIFYGGNGSGKSTMLNLIAQKLSLNRIAPFNVSELFDRYCKACNYDMSYDDEGFRLRVPNGSRIITSDDIFDYMLTVRTNNSEILEKIEKAKDTDYDEIKYGETVKMQGLEDYEKLRLQVLARKKSVSRRKFIQRTVGKDVRLFSNGETALDYFNLKMKNDTLYCLDEPENSLSPKLQLKLSETLQNLVRYCGCQLIIATHSPFLLAMENAKIYNFDCNPVTVCNWWELENTKIYFDFFNRYRNLFN